MLKNLVLLPDSSISYLPHSDGSCSVLFDRIDIKRGNDDPLLMFYRAGRAIAWLPLRTALEPSQRSVKLAHSASGVMVAHAAAPLTIPTPLWQRLWQRASRSHLPAAIGLAIGTMIAQVFSHSTGGMPWAVGAFALYTLAHSLVVQEPR